MDSKINQQPFNNHQPMLWKQIVGFITFSILIFILGRNILLILTGIFCFADAWQCGIYKKKDKTNLLNISPMSWGIAMQALLLITYPLYLIKRNELKTRDGKQYLFVLTIIFGGLCLLLSGLLLLTKKSS